MSRDRLSSITSFILTAGVLTVYSALLDDFLKEYGLWGGLPLLLFVTIGVYSTANWIDSLLRRKSFADLDIHDAHFPTPSVKAGDWDERLFASEESIAAAMSSAQDGVAKLFGITLDDGAELIALWHKDGWEVRFFRFDGHPQRLALTPDSKWAGKEVQLATSWWGTFKKWPQGRIDDGSMTRLAAHFMGWETEPDDIAWCTFTVEDNG